MRVLDGAPGLSAPRARLRRPIRSTSARDGPCVLAHGARSQEHGHASRAGAKPSSRNISATSTTARTIRFREETIRHLQSLLGVEARDRRLRPASRFRLDPLGAEASGLPIIRVQHHVAHVAATAAEHGWRGRAARRRARRLRPSATDGAPWGGELIDARRRRLAPRRPSGAARAARRRQGGARAVAHGRGDAASNLGRGAEAARLFPGSPEAARLAAALARGARCADDDEPRARCSTPSPRWPAFVCVQRYEGQAAMELEALVRAPRRASRRAGGSRTAGSISPPFAERLIAGAVSPRDAAERFHAALIDGARRLDRRRGARERASTRIALGGGCLMNRVLADGLCAAAARARVRGRAARARFPPTTAAFRSDRRRSRWLIWRLRKQTCVWPFPSASSKSCPMRWRR